jgi:hypothetical protein
MAKSRRHTCRVRRRHHRLQRSTCRRWRSSSALRNRVPSRRNNLTPSTGGPRRVGIASRFSLEIVGATTFLIDSGLFYTLKLTVLQNKPVAAKIIAGIVAARTWRDLADQLTARQIERLETLSLRDRGCPTTVEDGIGVVDEMSRWIPSEPVDKHRRREWRRAVGWAGPVAADRQV